MPNAHPIRTTLTSLLAVTAALSLGAAPAARADEIIAADTSAAAPTATAAVPTAVASRPRTIVVTHHDGRSVTLFSKGEVVRQVLAPGARPAVFTGLTAGRLYIVAVGGQPIGSVMALDRPSAAHSLVVRRGSGEGAVRLSWRQAATAASGGDRLAFTVTATSPTAPTVARTVTGVRSLELAGLDPSATYTFTVTPRNAAGAGRASRAVMSAPLGRVGTPLPSATPVDPAPPVKAVPVPASAPAPAPSTRTIYRCPDGFAETAGLCQATKAYTFTTRAYSYHSEVTGPAPLIDSFETTSQGCPTGYNLQDYGWIAYCRLYGPAPTIQVKDSAPSGFTDDGTQWVAKAPAPEGYVDDGTQWLRIVPKEAVVVPA